VTQEDLDSARECLAKSGLWPLVDAALQESGFTLEDLLDTMRTPKRLNLTRFRVWYEARERRDELNRRLYSFPELGRLFNRNHTTIIDGVRKHAAAIQAGGCRIRVP
jgi:hypothetical protein